MLTEDLFYDNFDYFFSTEELSIHEITKALGEKLEHGAEKSFGVFVELPSVKEDDMFGIDFLNKKLKEFSFKYVKKFSFIVAYSRKDSYKEGRSQIMKFLKGFTYPQCEEFFFDYFGVSWAEIKDLDKENIAFKEACLKASEYKDINQRLLEDI